MKQSMLKTEQENERNNITMIELVQAIRNFKNKQAPELNKAAAKFVKFMVKEETKRY